MRRSQIFLKTRKEAPADEEAKNAQLLIRTGYIHKEMAGVYSYTLLGKKVIDNLANIVREEMNAIGSQEILMSTLQNKEIWEVTDRWDDRKVDNWFKTKLLSGGEVGVGLSHEEPIVNMLKSYVNSYKDLPFAVYQVQTKFRNELRAKSGLLRGREFLMKDMYSFSRTQEEHDNFYNNEVIEAYHKVYSRLGIGNITHTTVASGGYFTERFSHEFQTVSHIGEDTIYLDKKKKIAVNKEVFTNETLAKLGLKREDLVEEKAVEVGNIFPLESKYSDALGLNFVDEDGQRKSIIMGCYGIGVSRLMGLLAEHFADDKGLVWPASIAPFSVYLARLGDEPEVVKSADEAYKLLTDKGIGVLYDDRDARPGEMFADADLLGIPQRLVVSQKTLESGEMEIKSRTSEEPQLITPENLARFIEKG
ncbi:prolyl-tRNA synthetase [bacterium G20]|nr:prolyl-tRNA synthetase [bacterium G20]